MGFLPTVLRINLPPAQLTYFNPLYFKPSYFCPSDVLPHYPSNHYAFPAVKPISPMSILRTFLLPPAQDFPGLSLACETLSYGWVRGPFIWAGAAPIHMGGRVELSYGRAWPFNY